jgi:signal transduction histidine kinase
MLDEAKLKQPERKISLAADCLAHDINNVFQTIVESADLIHSDPKWSALAEIIIRSVEQGRRVLDSLVEGERAAGLDEIVNAAGEFARDFSAATNGPTLVISHTIDPELRCTGRTLMIERALANLFVNSAEAAHASGALTCKIHVQAAVESDVVVITVSDDGPGIAPEILPTIFAPRFTTKNRGAGLGLHIVRRAIAESGGSVRARNGEQGGALFEITLPAGRARAASEAAVPPQR